MSTKISRLEIENVKRVKAVSLEPVENGLTIVGGKNNQGKTSVLDAIAWALGGEKYRPSEPRRDGSVIPPALHIELSNGLVVERKGKNSDLKVIDPSGNKAGQSLLNNFVETFALDLPKFMEASSKEKAKILLQVIGVGDKLFELERQETELYNKRLTIGQIADQKKKHAAELTAYSDAPAEPVSASELIKEQQEILARNGENQRKREHVEKLKTRAEELWRQIDHLQQEQKQVLADLDLASKTVQDLEDQSTVELEESIANIDAINQKVRANLAKEQAEDAATEYKQQYDDLSVQIEEIRKAKMDLLSSADLPLTGLSVEDGELTYQGYRWDNMSGSQQLMVAAAIVRKLNPDCGFVLLDKLEQMDLDTLKEFGAWLEQEGLQAIATRVSTGDECSILIEDGYAANIGVDMGAGEAVTAPASSTWKEGEF